MKDYYLFNLILTFWLFFEILFSGFSELEAYYFCLFDQFQSNRGFSCSSQRQQEQFLILCSFPVSHQINQQFLYLTHQMVSVFVDSILVSQYFLKIFGINVVSLYVSSYMSRVTYNLIWV